MSFKSKIYSQFQFLLNQKIQQLQLVLNDLKETGANETKSTAGDKHETALAMIQIEQANKRAQLNEFFTQKAALDKIDPLLLSSQVITGSLVKTNKGAFFISTSLGKVTLDKKEVTAISPQSPLGSKLIGLTVGNTIEVNNNHFIIEGLE
ncbi:MAG: hypothetical protein V4717_10405 [Bacteroidota bacterium]